METLTAFIDYNNKLSLESKLKISKLHQVDTSNELICLVNSLLSERIHSVKYCYKNEKVVKIGLKILGEIISVLAIILALITIASIIFHVWSHGGGHQWHQIGEILIVQLF